MSRGFRRPIFHVSPGSGCSATTRAACQTSLGLQYISAGLERLLLFLTPSFVLLIGLVALKRAVKRVGSVRLVALAMSFSSLACLLQYALLRPFGSLFEQSGAVWSLALLNAGLCTVLPVFMTMIAVARIGAGPASLAGMIGPVSTLFLAYWLLAEPITGLQLAGTALVLGGMLLLSSRAAPASAPREP